uniref:Uncharacterized protein n=1 Tax=Arundo donax TaxID=35708 RepID=A0A0A9C7K6_ARUDO
MLMKCTPSDVGASLLCKFQWKALITEFEGILHEWVFL